MANKIHAILGAFLLLFSVAVVKADSAHQQIPPGYAVIAENDQFQLYFDQTTLAFKLLDKRNDYLWHSGLDEPIDGDRLNRTWRAFALSGISMEYLDSKAVNTRISITSATTTITVTPIENGISAAITFDDFGISLELLLQLESEGIRVEIPAASIREDNPDFRLGRLYLYPFMGAARGSTIPGYMLLPDGVGSLIHFGDTTRASNMFYGRYYGADLGMIAYQPWDPYVKQPMPLSVPVFGMVHGEGQNAFLSVVEKGSAYGELQAHPAGIITNFNFLYHTFIYNETYFQATNRSGAGVTTVQRQTNAFDAVVHYRFLSGDAAHYVGLARNYQDYLIERGLMQTITDPDPNIGIRLEFLGGDKEKVLIWYQFIPMATVDQIEQILDFVQVSNPEVVYYGWQPLGASSMPPASLSMEPQLGSYDDLHALAERITADGGHFSLYLEPQTAIWGESGYSARTDLAMAITNVAIEGYTRLYNHYFTLDALQQRFTGLSSDIASRQTPIGLALDTIGSLLYSDYRDSNPLSREATIHAYQNLLTTTPLRLSLYRPNDYLFAITQAYFDMPLDANGYIYTSETVPFLPIVLAGHIPYYGTALNFSSNMQDDLLRQVEYGIYPSYFLTQEPTANMLNTPSSWIYTSSFAQWGTEIQSTYQWMNTLLGSVRGQEIIAHQQLAEGVFLTTYAEGAQIIVNYNTTPFVYGSVTIEAKDAQLLENGI